MMDLSYDHKRILGVFELCCISSSMCQGNATYGNQAIEKAGVYQSNLF